MNNTTAPKTSKASTARWDEKLIHACAKLLTAAHDRETTVEADEFLSAKQIRTLTAIAQGQGFACPGEFLVHMLETSLAEEYGEKKVIKLWCKPTLIYSTP